MSQHTIFHQGAKRGQSIQQCIYIFHGTPFSLKISIFIFNIEKDFPFHKKFQVSQKYTWTDIVVHCENLYDIQFWMFQTIMTFLTVVLSWSIVIFTLLVPQVCSIASVAHVCHEITWETNNVNKIILQDKTPLRKVLMDRNIGNCMSYRF